MQDESLKLVVPSVVYKESYLEALEEYHAEGRNLELDPVALEKDFVSFIQKFSDETEGKSLKPGLVPQTTYWIVDAGGYAGRISVRHALTESLMKTGGHIGYDLRPSKRRGGYASKALREVLPKVRELGITKALITCDSTNIPSKKIIEGVGGVLENEVPGEEGKPSKLRYWVTLF